MYQGNACLSISLKKAKAFSCESKKLNMNQVVLTRDQKSKKCLDIKLIKLPKAIATAYGSFVANSDRISKECLTATGSANETLHL